MCGSPTSSSSRLTTSRWPTSHACGGCSKHEAECQRLLRAVRKAKDRARFPVLPAYDQALKCSQSLQSARCARGNQRHGARRRHRARAETGGRRGAGLGRATERSPREGGCRRWPDFLLEIGAEEIPDWMIDRALADLRHGSRGWPSEKLGGNVLWDGSHSAAVGAVSRRAARRVSRYKTVVARRRNLAGARRGAGLREEEWHHGRRTRQSNDDKGEYFSLP